MTTESHCQIVLENWRRLQQFSTAVDKNAVVVKGKQLTLAEVVAVARYGSMAVIDKSPELRESVDKSVNYLRECVEQGEILYGINTGFGGSANTTTDDTKNLQISLMQMQQYGVISNVKNQYPGARESSATTEMPESWVRASMLVRCNTLVQGHSGVRFTIIEALTELLNRKCTPLVPLRGSISASGDLSPLSYIAGVLEGNPKLLLRTPVGTGTTCQESKCQEFVPADRLLSQIGMQPISFGPKEGLGLINGTAVSAAVAAMGLHETHHMAVLSQVLTAVAVEVMSGNPESFDPFIAQVRPHPGQIECAANISKFLQGSKLTQIVHGFQKMGVGAAPPLRQDRYQLRTASQWMGPLLEDLTLAHKQVTVELNSTTDNPLIDSDGRRTLHGGNFQALSVTVAMDKARSALQLMSKMLFAQCTEIINPDLNNGLPPNLCFDEPSLSYCLKGVDIGMAAYTSELGFLAHPVGPNVQSAEMSNQAINSLALISARYTQTAIDVFSMLAASYIYVLCQGLDLRVLQLQFLEALQPLVESITTNAYGPFLTNSTACKDLNSMLWTHITSSLKSASSTTKDSQQRFTMVSQTAQSLVVTFFASHPEVATGHCPQMTTIYTWSRDLATAMAGAFKASQLLLVSPKCPTSTYLGSAARIMYDYVRQTLRVPLNRGLVDHPTFQNTDKSINTEPEAQNSANEDTQIIGTYITRIYEALRSEALMFPIMECLEQGTQNGRRDTVTVNTPARENRKSISKSFGPQAVH
ncbi:L-Aspartase-like protein [Penicillium frequentans]|uniref:L-Aspartase-like protein n=1 Tax=Penicillium frequentans TaxID=3151616 RepID=A0AAD6CSM2_9EURO|nr:L-Aspartase-like protein [Penicillium glabrum]